MSLEGRTQSRARVLVVGSDETARRIASALDGRWQAEVSAVAQAGQRHLPRELSPDLVVCEISDPRQALDHRQELGRVWPSAILISCEAGILPSALGVPSDEIDLHRASEQAGYQGHLLVNEAALHLPFFLRYAELCRINEQRERQLNRLNRLLEASRRMHTSLDQQQVADAVLSEFSRWINADNWCLYAVSDDGQFLELVRSEGVRSRPQRLTLAVGGAGQVELTLRQGESTLYTHKPEEREEETPAQNATSQPPGSVLCAPVEADGRVIGVAQASRGAGHDGFTAQDGQTLEELAKIAAPALENAAQFARAERLYMQDDLTQLYNSRYLRQFLDKEIRRVRRYGGSVSVIFIDLDGFKQVNDRFGHRVGSETLKQVAGLLGDSVRETDVVARYGGDEFTLILPETNAEQSLVTAERVRSRIADCNFTGSSPHTFHLTASFGIATFPDHPVQSAMDLLEKADLAMYAAKAANKNNVKLAS